MRPLVLISLVLWAACGGDDKPTEGEKACDALEAKLDECRLTTTAKCNTEQPCAVRCAAAAECAQLTAAQPSGSLLQCIAGCSGAGPGDFVCADGRKFTSQAAVCDGQFQCLDGSDEADCATSGADAGGG